MKSQSVKPNYDMFINREISWLGFNRRVLELADSKHVPLGEKLKFGAIFASNLDEFFMVRIGSLFDQTLLNVQPIDNKTGLNAQGQLDAIMPVVSELLSYRDDILDKLLLSLEDEGIYHIDFKKASKQEEKFWRNHFLNEIAPLLSPQVIDRRHPFPFLRNLESYVAMTLKVKGADKKSFGLIPISTQLPRLVVLNADNRMMFAFTEEIILHYASQVFPDLNVSSKCAFRITRNADLSMSEAMMEHELDYRLVMSELLKKRRKLAAVRLELSRGAPAEIVEYLQEKLQLHKSHCIFERLPLGMGALYDISKHLKQRTMPSHKLFYTHRSGVQPPKGYSLADSTVKHDLLISYPFHSMRPFIKLLYEAAVDPDVISIKMTLYRLASDSKVIDALIAASDNGKEVVTVVELRARFDEQNNIHWANRLEDSGCTVIYGYEDYKVHSKLCLITKIVNGKKHYISFVGTGNFNESTAELYTDISYITQKNSVGTEIAALFHDLSLGRKTPQTDHLLVAPLCFKTEIIRQIEREMEQAAQGNPAKIVIKCNSVSDKDIMRKLAQASCAGVKIEMIIRGICCLRAGVKGVTENITVTSIVGRYLEHSRIYVFGQGSEARIYIASADFLTRNTERRVEVGIRIDDHHSRELLLRIINAELQDNINAFVMDSFGDYHRKQCGEDEEIFDSHDELYKIFGAFDTNFPMSDKPVKKVGFWRRLFGLG